MTTSSFDNDKEAAKSAVERADDSLVHAPLEDLDTKELDVAGGWLAGIAARPDAAELLAPYTEAEEKKMLRWKIDPCIMTLCQFATMMGAVDKVCIGTAAVLGLRTDTGLVGQQYSHISSAIYYGAIAAVFPSLYLMQRLPAARWISFNVALWGIIMMCMSQAHNFAGLMIARVILGCFEAVIFGGFGLIVAMWWTKNEQPFRTAVIFSTLSSVMNGIVSFAVTHISATAKVNQWRSLFLIHGAITFILSIPMWLCLPNSPTSAWWLTDRQKVIATRRLADNRTGMENKKFKKSQFVEALVDPKTWLIFCINLVLNIPNGGLVTFNSIIVASLGFTIQQTTLLAIPTGVISWLSSLFVAWLAVKLKRRFAVTIFACFLPFIGTIVLYTVPRSNIGGSLAGLYVLYTYWAPYTNTANLMYSNTGGHTKKIITYAIAYIGYCVGNLVGPQVFKANQAPKYTSGVVAMLVCYLLAVALLAVHWVYVVYLNKKKAIQLAEYKASREGKPDLLEDWQDQTDFENPYFVYTT